MSDNFTNKLSFEDKIVIYQKKLDEKYKLEFEQKLKEFQEMDLARIRVEERDKQKAEMQAYRLELENAYKKRNDALRTREKTLDEMLKQRNQAEEREIYLQRQHLLEEIKQVREKEADQRRNADAQIRLVQIDAGRCERMDEELRRREAQLRQSEKEIEERVRDEREKIKLNLERMFAEREFLLQSIDIKNKQDASNNELEKGTCLCHIFNKNH
jgi:hypothetical protein